MGAFGTLSALERREDEDRGTAWDLDRFAGLAQRRPGWAVAMADAEDTSGLGSLFDAPLDVEGSQP